MKAESEARGKEWGEYNERSRKTSAGEIGEDASRTRTASTYQSHRTSTSSNLTQSQAQSQPYLQSTTSLWERPRSRTTSTSSQQNPYHASPSQPEITRLSGQFNAPTHVEIERHRQSRRSRDGTRGMNGVRGHERDGKRESFGKMVRRWWHV